MIRPFVLAVVGTSFSNNAPETFFLCGNENSGANWCQLVPNWCQTGDRTGIVSSWHQLTGVLWLTIWKPTFQTVSQKTGANWCQVA